jgi:hypothetical protein
MGRRERGYWQMGNLELLLAQQPAPPSVEREQGLRDALKGSK